MSIACRCVLSLLVPLLVACGPVRPAPDGFADLPMAGLGSGDETPLHELATQPARFAGQTVRTRVRVAEVTRSPQGIFLWVLPPGAPIGASRQRLLFPPGAGGEDLLDMQGRDLVLVMEVQDVVSTLGVYEVALVVRPISYLSLFGTAADGGAAAAALRERLEREADMPPSDQSAR